MKIKVSELTEEAFAPYGTFVFPSECDNNPNKFDADLRDSVSFYPDQIVLSEFMDMPAMSVISLSKREFIIDVTEIHESTEEIFGGFDADTLFHVAVPSEKTPDFTDIKAFRLPKGGYVRLKRKVWHQAPYVVGDDRTVGIVILPPNTYKNDCFVVDLEEKIFIDM